MKLILNCKRVLGNVFSFYSMSPAQIFYYDWTIHACNIINFIFSTYLCIVYYSIAQIITICPFVFFLLNVLHCDLRESFLTPM